MKHKASKRSWSKAATTKNVPYNQAAYIVLSVGLIIASLVLFTAEPALSKPFLTNPFNIYRIAIMALAMIFLLLATKSTWRSNLKNGQKEVETMSAKTQKWLQRLQIVLPLLAIVFILLQIFTPQIAVVLIRKESQPFYRTGIFIKAACQIVGLVFFIKTARFYFKKKNYLAGILSCLFALALFVMAGEELSWGQRIFHWNTPESYAKVNAQGETNLHNLATQAFQNTLYFGGWLLLVALPFFQSGLDKLFSKTKHLKFVGDFLPPIAFTTIFAVAFGLFDPLSADNGLYWSSNLFIVLGTLVILCAEVYLAVKSRTDKNLGRSLVLLALYIGVAIGSVFFNKAWKLNAGVPTEYLELFISFGIMLWAIIVNGRTHSLAKRTISASAEDAD